MDFKKGYCTFCDGACKCAEVCPTGPYGSALIRLRQDRHGRGRFRGMSAVSQWLRALFEGCIDACAYEALSIDDSGHLRVDVDACNGCRACEHACPSSSYGSYTGSSRRGINIEAWEAMHRRRIADMTSSSGGKTGRMTIDEAHGDLRGRVRARRRRAGVFTGRGNPFSHRRRAVPRCAPSGRSGHVRRMGLLPRALLLFAGIALVAVVFGRPSAAGCATFLISSASSRRRRRGGRHDERVRLRRNPSSHGAKDAKAHEARARFPPCGLGATLLSAAVFGFPVFCLIARSGLRSPRSS
ncbi:MAG: 4Fe-4S binding protein [Eggerthellaceae bacterium]